LSEDRLIILGIDALDWNYVERRRSELPGLASWPVVSPLASIFPPDSIPAWTTIFTGRGPGDHGCLDSIDYLDNNTPEKAATAAASALPHNTFWDTASERGMKVCVVNPFLAYPAWDVNGVMIAGPVFVDGTASITGIDPEELPPLPQLGGIVTFPTRKTVGPFVEQTLRDTREQADFGRQVLQQTQPDVFFMNILTVDRIKHFLWRYTDPEDPTYPGPNPNDRAIDRMYDLVSAIVGEFSELGDVVVLSDHGHARRCTRMVYVDEALRRAGLIHAPGGRTRRLSKAYLIERAKKLTLRTAYELAKEEEIYRLGRRLPARKSLKYSSFSSNADKSIARLSRTFGRNAHSGVELNADTSENRQRVVEVMREIRDPTTGGPVVEWIKEREEVVAGASIEAYPAVLFKLKGGYGVDFGLYGGLFAPDVNHRRISGGHRPIGVFGSSMPVDPPASIEQFHEFVVGLLHRYASTARQ
jgi:predicted AlkP superfamily pyrophosphatase or phosphodiesterase